ncbi:ATPase, T2SS/T4P/T4SS family [Halomonas sp. NO4]|uniref:GspE/PulE family protein n=1 Tax=Halomonas sp. NO4 TaxID=2484813 RepID=UPI0013D1F0AC|nr:ATPase, T2SS/T4P/T4SS family [Halomonas sp. NO4]
MAADDRTQGGRPPLLPGLNALLETPVAESRETSLESDVPGREAEALLRDASRARASDIHLDPYLEHLAIRLRIDGRIVEALHVDSATGARLANQFKVMAGLNPVPALTASEGGFAWIPPATPEEEVFLRVSAVSCVAGEKLAIRFLLHPRAFPDTLALGIGEQGAWGIRRWMDATGGMLLVAGPTGTGKTTTLYTLLQQLRLADSHVITLEDPVEYAIPGINQVQVEARHGLDFAHGTRAMLRLDPDYVLLGELRDPGSAQAAVAVASSGRSLMSTLHSRDAVGVVSSLRHLGLTDAEIGANLGLVIAQRLVRCLCEHCREYRPTDREDAQWLDAVGLEVPPCSWGPVGCEHCDGLGYRGRTGVFELWQPTPEDLAHILRHDDEAALRRSLVERGETLMFAEGLAKAQAGITSLREVFRMGAILAT